MTGKARYNSLIKSDSKKHPEGIDLQNIKNLGYEGQFWFGNPSQKMQVIFDTGSAQAWLFSETCTEDNCPLRAKKFEEHKSTEFKKNNWSGQVLEYGKGAIMGYPS